MIFTTPSSLFPLLQFPSDVFYHEPDPEAVTFLCVCVQIISVITDVNVWKPLLLLWKLDPSGRKSTTGPGTFNTSIRSDGDELFKRLFRRSKCVTWDRDPGSTNEKVIRGLDSSWVNLRKGFLNLTLNSPGVSDCVANFSHLHLIPR